MSKLINTPSVIIAFVGGIISYGLGGWDKLLKVLVALVILDYITGILKAIYNKELSSEVGYRGIIRKILIFVVVATAYIISKVFNDNVPLRDIAILFYASNEAISILENAAFFIPIPKKIKELLAQLRNYTKDGKDGD